ncbi:SRPBCC family protein [Paraliomyxa miuraensis]|uniref:SRPBCC family protein n=1 Tax=Paraliomyxa miuraensis TaxID=376150 RepID=UPI00225692BF|nr:SRPBCC family protein [Paraliomyxa miuraensis]MCX4243126.1 SRPBCC family protein [Paraliomyxa miuraensis]
MAPSKLAHLVGMRADQTTRRALRLHGLRELVTGVGVLVAARRGRWLWMRVGGDLLDLGILAITATSRRPTRRPRTLLTALAAVTVLDVLAASRAARGEERSHSTVRALPTQPRTVKAAVTIGRPIEEVYAFWRKLDNLSAVMVHVESIVELDERRSHWTVRGPAGTTLEWDAEITEDRPNEMIAWRSTPEADVRSCGVVHFVPAPGGRGTEIHAQITYDAPGGRVGAMLATLFGREPGQQARGDLRRLKQVLETGEILHSDASIHPRPHPARPPTKRDLVRYGIAPRALEPPEPPIPSEISSFVIFEEIVQ